MRTEGREGFVGLLWAARPQSWLQTSCRHQGFTSYLQKHDEVLTELEKATKKLKKLETVYKEFELQKVCYLPLNTFLLKPIQRLMHYKLILERLCKHYSPTHRDHDDCKGQLRSDIDISNLCSLLRRVKQCENVCLDRDCILVDPMFYFLCCFLFCFLLSLTCFYAYRGSEGSSWDRCSAPEQSHPTRKFPEADRAAERPDWYWESNSTWQSRSSFTMILFST